MVSDREKVRRCRTIRRTETALLDDLLPSQRPIIRFSSTDSSGNTPQSSGEKPMPRLARSCGGSLLMISPWNTISPTLTGRKPFMLSMVVVCIELGNGPKLFAEAIAQSRCDAAPVQQQDRRDEVGSDVSNPMLSRAMP
jgi:hypothetical protein